MILLAFVDALWTALWVDGNAGPHSARITTWSWRGALALIERDRHLVLSLFGPFILAFVVLLWISLLWLGWTLVYAGDQGSLLHATTNEPTDRSGRFYFVGQMLFAAGNGDHTPDGDVWQTLAALTNMNGMSLATLAITYLLPVVSAAVQKRAFGSQVAGLGSTAAKS
ncbi:hypothetical protein [Palleronia sp.]|uniref:hypothetical protein n=1 Tax=Palleronia sp. TaxID=1940284 RepID=UPI0035C86FB4